MLVSVRVSIGVQGSRLRQEYPITSRVLASRAPPPLPGEPTPISLRPVLKPLAIAVIGALTLSIVLSLTALIVAGAMFLIRV